MQDELDKDLQSLFLERSQNLPEEPFLSRTIEIIQKRHSRRVFLQRLILAIGICFCAFLSPVIVRGSILLSSVFNRLFNCAGEFLDKPAVMAAAVVCTLLVLIVKRRLISRFV